MATSACACQRGAELTLPVSIQHSCIFIHVPKTGGTSIEKALGLHRDWHFAHLDVLHGQFILHGKEYLLQHLALSETTRFASLFTDVTNFFKFGFVRNPWDRLVSEYFWRKEYGATWNFDDFIFYACDCVLGRKNIEGENCHFRPQNEMLDGEIDFIGRFENYQNDVKCIFDKLGIGKKTLPHENKTSHWHYSRYYNGKTRRKVYDAYAGDVAKFGYEFEG